ncbi:LuxR C-terminal-related transcriptional regulator [Jannaschia formosa]|uniref:LuxR C-terminal-related transcriptional regulator n=1 Tax=Jannaschia formosa TaxID=2259592 RepID=UPI002473D8CD|nr:LuxR C-terminal-related transcriptional regulator [Jannaschia formosa]
MSRDPSLREREVLGGIATGQSHGVIAQIPGLSPQTVDTIIGRNVNKLEETERTTAALRGAGPSGPGRDRRPARSLAILAGAPNLR